MFDKIKIILRDIKIEHTVFGMPFLYSGAIIAAGGIPSAHVLLWITIGIISARTAAMSLNRLIDEEIDAKNPRTRNRALPSGLVTRDEMKALTAVSLVVLFIAALMLNWLCVALYPIAVSLFVVYPYLKRYTWLSHIVLGMTLGMAPIGAWAAVRASLELAPILLGLAVTFWVAGFDVIYSYQDLDFDREFNLHSIPKRFGVLWGLRISAFFHALTVLFLLSLIFFVNLRTVFLLGVGIIALLLIYEHRIIRPDNLEKVPIAFFNVNAIVGVCFLIFIGADVLL
jgi:4-hydroxybenzoate polyprenyltransferase